MCVRLLILLVALSGSIPAHAHELGSIHTDEYLSSYDANALGMESAQTDFNSSIGPISRLQVVFPGFVSGQLVQGAMVSVKGTSLTTGKPCHAVEHAEHLVDPSDESKGWRSLLVVESGCEGNAYVVGIYGNPGAMVFYWVGYD